MMRPGTLAGIRDRTRPGGRRRRSGSPPSTRSRPGGFARASSGSASAARRSNGRWRPTAWGPRGANRRDPAGRGDSLSDFTRGNGPVEHRRPGLGRTPRAVATRSGSLEKPRGWPLGANASRVHPAPGGSAGRCGAGNNAPTCNLPGSKSGHGADDENRESSGCRVLVFPARVPGRGPPSACVGALGSRAGARRRRRSRSPRTVRLPIPS